VSGDYSAIREVLDDARSRYPNEEGYEPLDEETRAKALNYRLAEIVVHLAAALDAWVTSDALDHGQGHQTDAATFSHQADLSPQDAELVVALLAAEGSGS